MIRIIKESKEDIQKFIDKFGEEIYNKVKLISNTPEAKKMKLNDLTFCTSRYSKDDMIELLGGCEKEVYSPKFNKRFGGALAYRFNELIRRVKSREVNEFVIDNETGEILDEVGERLDYKYWLKKPKRELISFIKEWGYTEEEKAEIEEGAEEITEENGWIEYKITNYLASEYYGMGSGWCISGAYPGSYERGEHFFYDYSDEGYYFIINEEADERYCMFADDNALLQIWCGSHGRDFEIESVDDMGETPARFAEDISENLDLRLKEEVPDDPEEQVDMIEEYFKNSDWVEFLTAEYFYGAGDFVDIMSDLESEQERYFRRDLTEEEQFYELKDYTNIVEDKIGVEDFEDLPEEVAENLWKYSSDYAKAWRESFGNFKNFFIETRGRWEDLGFQQAYAAAEDFGIDARVMAEYIVYKRRDGESWCRDIINSNY